MNPLSEGNASDVSFMGGARGKGILMISVFLLNSNYWVGAS